MALRTEQTTMGRATDPKEQRRSAKRGRGRGMITGHSSFRPTGGRAHKRPWGSGNSGGRDVRRGETGGLSSQDAVGGKGGGGGCMYVLRADQHPYARLKWVPRSHKAAFGDHWEGGGPTVHLYDSGLPKGRWLGSAKAAARSRSAVAARRARSSGGRREGQSVASQSAGRGEGRYRASPSVMAKSGGRMGLAGGMGAGYGASLAAAAPERAPLCIRSTDSAALAAVGRATPRLWGSASVISSAIADRSSRIW
jgi:hypothetical protein